MSDPNNFITTVPDHHDRIVWRGHYYGLPPTPSRMEEGGGEAAKAAVAKYMAALDFPKITSKDELLILASLAIQKLQDALAHPTRGMTEAEGALIRSAMGDYQRGKYGSEDLIDAIKAVMRERAAGHERTAGEGKPK